MLENVILNKIWNGSNHFDIIPNQNIEEMSVCNRHKVDLNQTKYTNHSKQYGMNQTNKIR